MKIQRIGPDQYQITLSEEEIGILRGCINEALDLDTEFSIRVGAEIEEAEGMLRLMRQAVESV